MPRWRPGKHIAKRELDETSLILVTLAVASGVDLMEALHCLHRMKDLTMLLPVVGRDLSPSFALAGCVLRHTLSLAEAREVERIAREQYPDWDKVKAWVKDMVRNGRDPRSRKKPVRLAMNGRCRFESDALPHTQNLFRGCE